MSSSRTFGRDYDCCPAGRSHRGRDNKLREQALPGGAMPAHGSLWAMKPPAFGCIPPPAPPTYPLKPHPAPLRNVPKMFNSPASLPLGETCAQKNRAARRQARLCAIRRKQRIPPIPSVNLEPMVGIEPTTSGLRYRCSTTELHRRGRKDLGKKLAPSGRASFFPPLFFHVPLPRIVACHHSPPISSTTRCPSA